MLEKIDKDEILLMQMLDDPISATECLFSDLENLTHEPTMQLGHIRFAQLPLLSSEYLLDYDKRLSKKENFKLHEGAGNIDCFGGRLFGKSHVVETVDILISIFHLDNTEVGFTSSDAIHIRAILEEKLFPVLNRHPFFEMYEPRINRSPNYRCAFKNGYTLIGINMNLGSKAPGQQFYGKHLKRLYVEEASFETEEVFNKRIEAGSEDGCVTRSAGMTNFTKYMPAGRRFYDLKNKPWVCNLPQYCNPKWDAQQKEKAVKKHGGEQSITYRIFVRGEVVEEGISVFDMEIVRRFYMEDKIIKKFEITKDNFNNFQSLLILDKPNGVEEVFIAADIGESAPTEIVIMFKVGEKYKYAYNITVYNLTDKQQPLIFEHIVNNLGATMIGIDTTDGTGRSIFRTLQEKYPSDNLSWCAFNEKLQVGFEKDDNGIIVVDEKGAPIIKEEYVSEWSVKRLKDLFYEGTLLVPVDYKLDKQLNSVVCAQAGHRTVYEVVGDEDHLFSAFRVFAIAEWHKQLKNLKPINSKKFAKSGV